MPIYDYKCNKCGKVFEYQQRISENALTHCPNSICEQEEKGSGEVKRIISKNIGLVFKGSGFYLTDYNNKKVAPAHTNSVQSKADSTKPESKSKETPAQAS